MENFVTAHVNDLEELPDFSSHPRQWLDIAERNFNRRKELIQMIVDGTVSSDMMSDADLIILELRLMELVRTRHIEEGSYNVMTESYSNEWH